MVWRRAAAFAPVPRLPIPSPPHYHHYHTISICLSQIPPLSFFVWPGMGGCRTWYTLYKGHVNKAAEAGKWLAVLRGIYPDAFVSEEPVTQTDAISDTQVLSILEERRAESMAPSAD